MKTFLDFLKHSKIILGITFVLSALSLILAHRPGDSLFVEIIAFFICWISLSVWPLIWKAVILAVIRAIKSKGAAKNMQPPRNDIPPRSFEINNDRTDPSRCTESHVFGERETFRHGDTVFEYQIPMDHSGENHSTAHQALSAPADDRHQAKKAPSLQKRRRQVAETLARVIPANENAAPTGSAKTAPSAAAPANDRQAQTSPSLQKQRQLLTETLAKVAEARSAANAAAPEVSASTAMSRTAQPSFTAAPTVTTAAPVFADPFLPEAANFTATVSVNAGTNAEADALRRETYRNSPLLDKHISFIGTFQRDRGELAAMVPTVGALFDPAVCESTDFVVLGDTSALAGQPEEAQLAQMNQLYSHTGKPRSITEADYISRIESALRWLEI